jgi:4-cresol dehydrogenase (hydroxylating)
MSNTEPPAIDELPARHADGPPGLAPALAAWRDLLGANYVRTEPSALQAAATATFATSQRVLAIVAPASRAEVLGCLAIASAHGVPLYPVSRGRNWGYGSRVPSQPAAAILDLARMNRIVDYDERLAYVTVEPGVTFQQLHDFLARERSELMLNVTGGPVDGSLIGNILERGIGLGPHAERAQHIGACEVVLPTGELIHTGYGRFDTPLAPLSGAGVGPQLAGLFQQSSYGVVTQMTVWLARKPAYFHTFYYQVRRPERLPALIDTLQELRLAGPPGAHYSLWNDYKVISTLQQYPWEAAGGRTPLPDATLAQLRQRWGVAPWNGYGAIYSCSARHGRAERALVAQALRGQVDDLRFVSDTTAWAARALARPLLWLTGYDIARATRSHDRAASPWLGAPGGNVASAYWRKRAPIPASMDPDADGCGVIWCSPCVPFTGSHVAAAIEIATRVIGAHGFEPNIALVCVTPRVVHAIIAILFDRAAPGEDERALECHGALLRALAERGYLPYRLGLQSAGGLPPPTDDDARLHAALRRALDPNNILGPGKYSP